MRINTALFSYGMSGKIFHAPFLHAHKGFGLAGAWERSAQQIAAAYPGTRSYSSLESVLHDSSIQLVIVNTPTATHYTYAKAALLADKNVVVEKAFTTTVSEAEELKLLAEERNLKLTVYQNRRWDGDFKTVQQVKTSGILGTIVEAELRFERYKPVIGPKLHKEAPGPGAGLLNDLGPHLIDQALCLFGMPEAVMADIRIVRKQSQVDDWFDISLQYPHLRVRLKSSLLACRPLPGFVLHGSAGSFIKSRADVQEADLQAGKLPGTQGWGAEPETEYGTLHTADKGVQTVPTMAGNYGAFYDAVFNALTTNLPMPVTAQDGIDVMKIIAAAVKSNDEKKLVEVR